MKIAVIIPAHTFPEVLKLTIKSLLRYSSGHELEFHVGLHTTYWTHLKDFVHEVDRSVFDDIPNLHLHAVEEIDWQNKKWFLFRYSEMHARNLLNLLHSANLRDFDYAMVIDQDLFFKGNAIDLFLGHVKSDTKLVHSYQEHKDQLLLQGWYYLAPQLSNCALISRSLVDELCSDIELIQPTLVANHPGEQLTRCRHDEELHKYYMSRFEVKNFENAKYGANSPLLLDVCGMLVYKLHRSGGMEIVDQKEVSSVVHHWGAMSLNFGVWVHPQDFQQSRTRVWQAAKEFMPNDPSVDERNLKWPDSKKDEEL